MQSKIIVIEGIDGSGKKTQVELLYKYLINKGDKVKKMHFPLYNKTFFGKEVANYLNGEFGGLDEIHPKLAAVLYAGDRFEVKEKVRQLLNNGYVLIFDRYVPSNIAHHASKFSTKEERNKFKNWVEKLEYSIFEIPKPNRILFLDMPPEKAEKLILTKGKRDYTNKKKDLHEENQDYLLKVYKYFKELCNLNNWTSIKCFNEISGEIKTKNEILDEIIDSIM